MIGVARNNYRIVLAGLILLLPVCFELYGYKDTQGAFVLPIFHVASIFALNEDRQRLAWLCLIPSILLALLSLLFFLVFGLMEDGVF